MLDLTAVHAFLKYFLFWIPGHHILFVFLLLFWYISSGSLPIPLFLPILNIGVPWASVNVLLLFSVYTHILWPHVLSSVFRLVTPIFTSLIQFSFLSFSYYNQFCSQNLKHTLFNDKSMPLRVAEVKNLEIIFDFIFFSHFASKLIRILVGFALKLYPK